YWNPASLASFEENVFGVSANVFTESEIDLGIVKDKFSLEGRRLNFLSVVGPQVGLFWRPITNRIDESEKTEDGKSIRETIDEKINTIGITVGIPHTEKADFGMNINYISGVIGYSKVENGKAEVEISDGYGWGLDWGFLYKLTQGVDLGITLLNGPGIIYWEDYDSDKFPPELRVGANVNLSELITVEVDYKRIYADSSVNNTETVHIGAEQKISDYLKIRQGLYGKDFDDKNSNVYTAGIGFVKQGYSIDFAVKQYYTEDENSSAVRRYSISGNIPF
ncbi:MAG: hypothetical protein ACOC5R_01925, partial [Elusimicrobiota bacterium]